jgi:S1-C subfamily serine protease
MGVSGTAFFIDQGGAFLTLDHIMNCAPAGSMYYYYGQVPDRLCQPAVEIERVASDPARDLYLGRIQRDFLRPVEFSTEAVRPGDSVCLAGYPMAVLSINAQGGFIGNVRRYWQPTFVIDATRAVMQDRAYDGYIVGHACFSGMSGGPAFDVDGKVRGMAVGTLTRTMPELDGDPTVVKNGIILDVAQIRAFIDQHLPTLSVARQ